MNEIVNREISFFDLGKIGYQEAWDYQEKLFNQIIQLKIHNRNLPIAEQLPTPNYFLFCEHPHVFTLGRSGNEKNLLVNSTFLQNKGATFVKTNRGGDITYHGPGQIVGYPVLDLENFFTDIHHYMRLLEETIILSLKEYGLDAGRIKGKTGVWLDYETQINARKICAMGVRCSRWVTMHGLAFNLNPNLDFFSLIVPCGIEGGQVTSLLKELSKQIPDEEFKVKMKFHFLEELEKISNSYSLSVIS